MAPVANEYAEQLHDAHSVAALVSMGAFGIQTGLPRFCFDCLLLRRASFFLASAWLRFEFPMWLVKGWTSDRLHTRARGIHPGAGHDTGNTLAKRVHYRKRMPGYRTQRYTCMGEEVAMWVLDVPRSLLVLGALRRRGDNTEEYIRIRQSRVAYLWYLAHV